MIRAIMQSICKHLPEDLAIETTFHRTGNLLLQYSPVVVDKRVICIICGKEIVGVEQYGKVSELMAVSNYWRTSNIITQPKKVSLEKEKVKHSSCSGCHADKKVKGKEFFDKSFDKALSMIDSLYNNGLKESAEDTIKLLRRNISRKDKTIRNDYEKRMIEWEDRREKNN